MTHHPGQSEGATSAFYDEAVGKIRNAGLRLTPQRTAILRLFDHQDAHLTPGQVFEALEDEMSSLSLATVYNNLEVFEDVGILDQIQGADGLSYFDPNTSQHQHAVCQGCDAIFDLDVDRSVVDGLVESMSAVDTEATKFEVDAVKIWFKGRCTDCQIDQK